MIAALILLAALTVTGVLLYLFDRRSDAGSNDYEPDSSAAPKEDACCGMHITCEKDSLLSSVSSEIEYYDDEELDTYAGKAPEDYSPGEIEEFREILLTLLPHDIAGWARSLHLRGISLPVQVRDELIMIVSEARAGLNTKTDA